ncbi:hypothetical protein ONE63_006330 [Megalurothrips usitatus]|uniref:Uncharacterized protein n=1 Tax=Megalurothrips usitatus TaxID=439358 RepID=A0AAV7XX77_9NEOP|nr:hypothetical protein ONE63_006330 [Megalurothrips usitatus]
MSAAKRLVLSLAGRRGEGSSPAAASSAGSSTRLVDRAGSGSGPGGGPGTPAGSGVGAPGGSAGSDLEEIAIVSNASGGQVKYGSGNLSSNGPRLVPGEYSATWCATRAPRALRKRLRHDCCLSWHVAQSRQQSGENKSGEGGGGETEKVINLTSFLRTAPS